MTAEDYAHVIIACLPTTLVMCGPVQDDDADGFVIDSTAQR